MKKGGDNFTAEDTEDTEDKSCCFTGLTLRVLRVRGKGFSRVSRNTSVLFVVFVIVVVDLQPLGFEVSLFGFITGCVHARRPLLSSTLART